MNNAITAEADSRMQKTMESVQQEFNKIRTGRANISLLDGIKVDYYGTQSPINQVANVSIPEARLIVIQPWDPKMLKEIEKAIQVADLNIAPINDGKVIRLPVPQLTEERRKDLVKNVKKILEEGKVSVRNTRREINEKLKKSQKSGDLSEDQQKDGEATIQKTTDKYIKDLDALAEKKEKEIMTV